MEFSNNLIEQFVRTTNNKDGYSGDFTVQGTIVVYGDSSYVKLDGSDLLTPISTTTEVADGDRVMVRLKNHTAIVTGNISDPAVGKKRADGLASEIRQTVEEIRLSVSNEVARLESSITMTADEIRSEVADEVNGLESKITQNSNQISILVTNQEGFSEFKQTVEGFSFMNKGGAVKISGGDINLTGAITFGDFSKDVSDEITNASTKANTALDVANSASSVAEAASETSYSAYQQAGFAINDAKTATDVAEAAKTLAENMAAPEYLQGTRIENAYISSPTIIGGSFYAMGQTAWANMTPQGLYIYTGGINKPKITLANFEDLILFTMGSGSYSDTSLNGQFHIAKFTTYTKLTYYSSIYPGVSANLIFDDDGRIIARRVNGTNTTSVTLIGN